MVLEKTNVEVQGRAESREAACSAPLGTIG